MYVFSLDEISTLSFEMDLLLIIYALSKYYFIYFHSRELIDSETLEQLICEVF